MKRLIAALSFAVLATPVFAQYHEFGPTSPIGPSSIYDFSGDAAATSAMSQQDPSQVASAGATRSDTGTNARRDAEELSRHVEWQTGYFDSAQ
jgi:hypothetical protein